MILRSWVHGEKGSDGEKGIINNWVFLKSISAAVPAVLMIFSSLWVSETPNALIERGHLDKAKKQLQRIRGVADVQAEFNDLVDASAASKEVEHPWRDLSMRKYRPQLCVAILIPMFQQLTRINVVMFYAPVLFKTIGFQINASLASAMITGGVNVLATFISGFGTERWGRKPLFLWGGGTMIVFQSAVAVLIGTKFGVKEDTTFISPEVLAAQSIDQSLL